MCMCVHACVRVHECTRVRFLEFPHPQDPSCSPVPPRGHTGPHLGWTGGAGACPRAGGTAPTSSLHLGSWCRAGLGSCPTRSPVRPSEVSRSDLLQPQSLQQSSRLGSSSLSSALETRALRENTPFNPDWMRETPNPGRRGGGARSQHSPVAPDTAATRVQNRTPLWGQHCPAGRGVLGPRSLQPVVTRPGGDVRRP